jgi:hypothetical protein
MSLLFMENYQFIKIEFKFPFINAEKILYLILLTSNQILT